MGNTARWPKRPLDLAIQWFQAAARSNPVIPLFGIFGWLVAIAILNPSLAVGADPLPPGLKITARFEPNAAPPGAVVELQVAIELPKNWIVFDFEQAADSAMPTRIVLAENRAFAPLETFNAPTALEKRDSQFDGRFVRYFDQSPTFRRKVLVGREASDVWAKLEGKLDVQVRDESTGKSFLLLDHPFSATIRIDQTAGMSPPPQTPLVSAAPKASVGELSTTTSNLRPQVPVELPKHSLLPPRVAPAVSKDKDPSTAAAPLPPVRSREVAAKPVSDALKAKPESGDPALSAPAPSNAQMIKPPIVAPETTPTPSPFQRLYDDPAFAKLAENPESRSRTTITSMSPARQPTFPPEAAEPVFMAENENRGDWRLMAVAWFVAGGWTIVPSLLLGFLIGGSWSALQVEVHVRTSLAAIGIAATAVGAMTVVAPRATALAITALTTLLVGLRLVVDSAVPSSRAVASDANARTLAAILFRGVSMTSFAALAAVTAAWSTVTENQQAAFFSPIGSAIGFLIGMLLTPRRRLFSDEAAGSTIETPNAKIASDSASTGMHGEPELAPLLTGLALLGLSAHATAQLDLLDGSFDWLSYYHVVAFWGACSAVSLLRLLLPWPNATRRVFRQPARLFAVLCLGWLTLYFFACTGEDPKTEGILAHLQPRLTSR